MKNTHRMVALVPTFIVAVVLLARDAGFYPFFKKVAGSYFFFWLLAVIFGHLWHVVARQAPRIDDKANDAQQQPSGEESSTA